MARFVTFLAIGFAMVFVTSAKITCPTNSGETSVYLPHETECGKFYECSASAPILFQCPTGLYFDTRLNICNWNVECGTLLTSTAPPATTAAEEEAEE